jgi:hypothetical protein
MPREWREVALVLRLLVAPVAAEGGPVGEERPVELR